MEKLVDRTIAAIRDDPKSYWIGMGDFFDLIGWTDNRFDPTQIHDTHKNAYFERLGLSMVDYGVKKFGPIAHKCVGLLEGNHEWKYENKTDEVIVEALADKLHIPYMGYSCFRDIVFQNSQREERFRIAAHHGAGWARTTGGKVNRLIAFMNSFEADIYIMGHIHAKMDHEQSKIAANEDCTELNQVVRLGVVSGSFNRGYLEGNKAGYVERALLPPAALGAPYITIVPDSRELGVIKPHLK
jgi:hypothetical protein